MIVDAQNGVVSMVPGPTVMFTGVPGGCVICALYALPVELDDSANHPANQRSDGKIIVFKIVEKESSIGISMVGVSIWFYLYLPTLPTKNASAMRTVELAQPHWNVHVRSYTEKHVLSHHKQFESRELCLKAVHG